MGSDPGHIGEHLAQLCDDIRGREPYLPDVLEQAVLIHHRAVQIHPFRNGNGRWSRMLSNIWLRIPRLPDRGMAGNDRRREPDSVGIPRLPPGRRRPRHQAAPRAPRPPPTRAQPTLTLCHRDVTGEEQSRFVFPQSMPPGSGFPRQAICTGINVLREEGLPLEQAILTYAAQRPVSRQAKQTGLVAKLAVAERRR